MQGLFCFGQGNISQPQFDNFIVLIGDCFTLFKMQLTDVPRSTQIIKASTQLGDPKLCCCDRCADHFSTLFDLRIRFSFTNPRNSTGDSGQDFDITMLCGRSTSCQLDFNMNSRSSSCATVTTTRTFVIGNKSWTT